MNEEIKSRKNTYLMSYFFIQYEPLLQRLRVSDMEGVVGVVNILVGHGMTQPPLPQCSASVVQ